MNTRMKKKKLKTKNKRRRRRDNFTKFFVIRNIKKRIQRRGGIHSYTVTLNLWQWYTKNMGMIASWLMSVLVKQISIR